MVGQRLTVKCCAQGTRNIFRTTRRVSVRSRINNTIRKGALRRAIRDTRLAVASLPVPFDIVSIDAEIREEG